MAVSGAVLDRAELLDALTPRLPRVTALIGGGGKTTLLYALGAHLAARGRAVVLTTTTHLGYDPAAVAPAGPEELNRLLDSLEAALGARIGRSSDRRRSLRGAELVHQLRRASQLNVNSGQLAGWLCAGMFNKD